MKRQNWIVLGLLAVLWFLLVTPPATAWQTAVPGTGSDQANAVGVDPSGNVVAAGVTQNSETGFDFTVVKLDGVSGGVIWQTTLTGTTRGSADVANSVVVDGAGNVVAAGVTENSDTSFDFTVVKLDGATGGVVWQIDLTSASGPTSSLDQALVVAVDPSGNVVAAGQLGTAISPPRFPFVVQLGDLTVVKLDGSTGGVIWQASIPGTTPLGTNVARSVAVDPSGNVVAAGVLQNTATGFDFTVVKLDGATGGVAWQASLSGTTLLSADAANSVAVDRAGNVVVAGVIENLDTGQDFTVVKLDGATGGVAWQNSVNLLGTDFFGQAFAMALDPSGNVVAAGVTEQSLDTAFDGAVLKLDGTSGGVQWATTLTSVPPSFPLIPASTSNLDRALAVAVDRAGDVVVAGQSGVTLSPPDSNIAIQSTNFVVGKLAGTTGGLLWGRQLAGTSSFKSSNEALAVVVDGAGDVVAAGVTNNTGTGEDFTVVKLRGSDGGDF